jgi:beta propeller repeat protein
MNMNAKHVLSLLLLMAIFATGCKPESAARSAATNTPAPQQPMRLSEPTKVSLSSSAVNLERLGQRTLVGNVLIASMTVLDTIHWISINLENGQVHGPQELLQVDSFSATTERYILRSTSYYDEKSQHRAGDLFVYDLQQDKEFQIADNQPGTSPVVSGDIVAWRGLGNGGWNIYAYDIATQQTVTVTHGAEGRSYPYIAGDWVIYLDMGEDKILHAYNLSAQEALTLGAVPYPRGREGKYHLISNDKVVWADAAMYDLHVLDLSTRVTEVITDPVTTCKPLYTLESMAGHTLLYTGCKGRALYDLDSKSNVDIPAGGGWIVMSDNRVVWQEGNDLYTVRIER